MRHITLLLLTFYFSLPCAAQTDVTTKYIDNPDFEARFAGWDNEGSLTFNTSKNYSGQNGMVFMEKWVAKGGKLGTNAGIHQTLVGLPAGTYTLTANAQNIQQGSDATQTGAFLYAGNEQTEISATGEYKVTFTVLSGETTIGVNMNTCTGNWVCVDNFRLFYKGVVEDSIKLEMQKLITEAESVVGDGVTGAALQTSINNAKKVITEKILLPDEQLLTEAQAATLDLQRAILLYRISNGTGSVPKVSTTDFVPTGVTIALGRLTATGTGIKERGFCWSTEPEPTVLDHRSTRYFSNNGNIYCMEHMQPATVYYIRAYAITSGWQVGYGDVVKIATLPKGTVTTWYDNAAEDEQMNFRIASATNEVQWLYDNLSNIRGFNLSVHFVYNCGSNGQTADCSYGGWMRVSYNTPYQQTGTILHETNHGVGVGTTNEWYNNSNLRAETSRGLWLGPRAIQVVRFFENSQTATLNGDNTHMWPYGINGAHEDSYNPEKTILYYGNVFTTHALHQDGLICSENVGFATPAYVFQQTDNQKYYLTCEDGDNVNFLTITTTGTLQMKTLDTENRDNFAWYITYDPKTSYYLFQNVGTGKYMTYASGSIKTANKSNITTNEKFHLLPARQTTTMGQYTGTGYWITHSKGGSALQAGASNTTSPALNFSNAATNQRWLFLTEEQLAVYDEGAAKLFMDKLNALLSNAHTIADTPHKSKLETIDVTETDEALATVISNIESNKDNYASSGEVSAAISQLQTALMTFLTYVVPISANQPFDLTFLITNPGLDTDTNGWSTTASNNYSCCEFFETTFDFNQTTALKVPAGTYELRVQAFQRPGTASATATEYLTNGTDNVKTQIYLKAKAQKVKNIWADAQSRSLGGSTSSSNGKYVPNNMLAASKWFAAGWYDNSVMTTTTSAATLKLGIRCTASDASYWTCFDNFRLYFYGNYSIDEVTPIESIETDTADKGAYYDLSGRQVARPTRGLYIHNGKKVLLP